MRAAVRGTTALLAAAPLLAACTGGHPGESAGRPTTTASTAAPSPSAPATGSGVVESSTLVCANAIDGSAPPAGYTVILGAVGLPASPRYAALQTGPTLDRPKLFAKIGLIIRAGVASEIDVPAAVDLHVGLGWNNGPAAPGRHFVIPACPNAEGTGWLAYPGGFWADAPLCLPLGVRVGDQVQRVEIGVGKPCPGQAAPPTP